jgi:hypothetical protein
MSTTRSQKEEKWYGELSYRTKMTGGESLSTKTNGTEVPELRTLS